MADDELMAMSDLKVPQAVAPYADQVLTRTDRVCAEHLDEEYGDLCRIVIGRLGRKRPSPLTRGDLTIWAAGAVYVVGQLNFLFDSSQTPHATADDLSDWLGVKKTTMGNKGRLIREKLKLSDYEPELMRRDLLDNHPLTWILEVGGLPIDIRDAPLRVQEQALALGLIPYLPRQPPTSTEELARLVGVITVDAYNLAELVTAFYETFNAEVPLPVTATLAAHPVEVVGFGVADNDDEVTVECRRAGATHELRIADIVFPPDHPAGWIHAAYRRCLGLTPYPSDMPPGWQPDWL